jgi:hypothetical protein
MIIRPASVVTMLQSGTHCIHSRGPVERSVASVHSPIWQHCAQLIVSRKTKKTSQCCSPPQLLQLLRHCFVVSLPVNRRSFKRTEHIVTTKLSFHNLSPVYTWPNGRSELPVSWNSLPFLGPEEHKSSQPKGVRNMHEYPILWSVAEITEYPPTKTRRGKRWVELVDLDLPAVQLGGYWALEYQNNVTVMAKLSVCLIN